MISLPLSHCWTAKRPNKLLWRELIGNSSKQFPSGTSISSWHSGHGNFPSLWLAIACFSKHSLQKVWRQAIVLGLVYVPWQIEQVTRSLRFCKRDSIETAAARRMRNDNEIEPNTPGLSFVFQMPRNYKPWKDNSFLILFLAANQKDPSRPLTSMSRCDKQINKRALSRHLNLSKYTKSRLILREKGRLCETPTRLGLLPNWIELAHWLVYVPIHKRDKSVYGKCFFGPPHPYHQPH